MGDDQPQPSVPPERTWQHPQGESSSDRADSSKRGKILSLLAVMAGLAGIIVGLLLWINRFSPPHFLSITVTEYERHFPPIPLAEQDSKALLEYFPDRREAFESQEGDRLSEELHRLAARKEDPVVVHLCAYGLCRDNDVYIIPAKADPDNPSTKLSLRQVLSLFGECPAQHKLLILDIMRPLAEPRLGILINPVAERTQAILKEWEDTTRARPFFVLCPCAGGQVSLVSQELGMSVFGYYLCAGLSGQADGWNPRGECDQRVSVQELAAFVTYRVDRWADQNRGCGQTPVLFGKAKDFPLVAGASPMSLPVPEAAPKPSGTEQKKGSSPVAQEGQSSPPAAAAEGKTAAKDGAKRTFRTKLEKAWDVRDQWGKDKLYRVAPRSFRQLEGALVRAEQRRRAGIASGRIQEDVDSATSQKQLEQAKLTMGTGKLRFPALAVQNLQLDAATDRALHGLLAQQQTSPPMDKAIQDATKKLVQSFKDKAPSQLAWTIFSFAADDLNLSPKKIDLLLDLIKSIPGGLAPTPAEIDFLQKLRKLQPDDEGKWPTEAAHHGLRVVSERGKALNADARAWPWVRQALQAAEDKRREGERLLFEGGSERAAKAASVFVNTEEGYLAINASIQVIVRAQNTYDEAWAALPGFVPYLVNRPELNAQDMTNWQKATRSAHKLGDLFDRRMREPVSSLHDLQTETEDLFKRAELLREPLRDLEQSLLYLERPFRPDSLRDLQERAKSDGVREYLEMEALLESPRLSAKERGDLDETRRLLGQHLMDKTKARDDKENQDQARKMPPVTSAHALNLSEDDRAQRLALLAIDLLKLAGVVGASDLDKALNDKQWQKLGDKLLDVWARQLPQQFEQLIHLKPEELPQALRQADRLSRVFHPFDRYPGENSNDFSNPAARLLQQKTREFQKWLGASQP